MNNIATFMRESGPARALIPVGIFLIIFGIIAFFITVKNANYIQIESTVSNVVETTETVNDSEGSHEEKSYNVTVKYNVNGKEYETTLEHISKYKTGDKMKIYYDPSDPSKITMSKNIILPIVIFIGGIVALVAGIISASNSIKKHKRMKEQEKEWEAKNA